MSSQESPFVGCRIRIISKAKIRYEGYLFSIDTDTPNDPVITLSKVWSFGTEDRPSERHVGPRSEVYEQIVFRGRDLEDVRVIQSSVFLNDDPSIVSVEPGSVSTSQERPREDGDAPDLWTGSSVFGNLPKPIPIASVQQQPSVKKPVPSFPNFMSPKPPADLLPKLTGNPWNPISRVSAESDRTSVLLSGTSSVKDANADDLNGNRHYSHEHEFHDDRMNVPRGRGSQVHRGYNRDQKFVNKSQNEYQDNQRDDINKRYRQGTNQSSFARGGRGRIHRPKPWVPNEIGQQANNFEGDYDIDKANAELAEELEKIDITNASIDGSVNEDSVKEESDCYDSKKSFFDTISSEMMDRSQGINRQIVREDRRQNVDTFGPAASRMGGNNYRGGNRYNNYSRRGVGGRRGGQFGNNSGGGSYNWSNDRPRYRQPTAVYASEPNVV